MSGAIIEQPEAEQPTGLAKIPANRVPLGMLPQTMEEGIKLSNMLAKSTLVPKDFQNNPANVFIAIQWGAELGLAPMQALQSIAVINGRPSIWGDGMLALVMGSPVFEWIDEPPVAAGVATCSVKRKGSPNAVTRTFSLADAEKAGLKGKPGPWQQYQTRMLQMRARGFALRDAFPDVLRGVISAEEAMDIPSHQPAEFTVERIEPPKPTEPDGYAQWLVDMEAVADEGMDRLTPAWKASSQAFRDYLTSTNPEGWDGLKTRAESKAS